MIKRQKDRGNLRREVNAFVEGELARADKKSPNYKQAVEDYKLVLKMGDKRACGECSACCTVLGVDGLEEPKPRQTACKHDQSGGGCDIYAERPHSCRDFYCAWKSALTPAALRPDKVGVVFWIGFTSQGVSWFADECVPGALGTLRIKDFIRTASEKRPMLLYQPDGSARIVMRGVDRGQATTIEDEVAHLAALTKIRNDLGIG